MKAEYEVVVAGADLGGLSGFGTALKRRLFDTVIEKLPCIGRRLANIPHKGFQLTTGTLHLIPITGVL